MLGILGNGRKLLGILVVVEGLNDDLLELIHLTEFLLRELLRLFFFEKC
jgi:hypothetical protein